MARGSKAENAMAPKARIWWDERGRLNVVSQGTLAGRRRRKRVLIPDNDEELAAEVKRQLNTRFALGDYSDLLPRVEDAAPVPSRLAGTVPFEDWASSWLESYRPPAVSPRCHENYRHKKEALTERFGRRPVGTIGQADILDLRAALESAGKRPSTVRDHLAVLRLILRDAVIRGHIDSTPFAERLPTRRTKRQRSGQRSRRVTFRPFTAQELGLVLDVLRVPRDATEARYFPLAELLLLTGLRWGEGAGLCWSHVSWAGGLVHIAHAAVRGEQKLEETKTAAEWTIPVRPPLSDLLMRQRERSYVGRTEGLVFPGPKGAPLSYSSWLRRGWRRALDRAKVNPREGDAQKALRRSYSTSALICDRNPKLVSSEIGHATTRMVTDQYDSFIDPSNWPSAEEREQLAGIYGWPGNADMQAPEKVPYGSPEVPARTEPRDLDS